MTESMHKASDGRLRELDLLRGAAALWVVLYHYLRRYHEMYGGIDPLGFRIPNGVLGVQLFFMISGFVIFMTLHRSRTGWDFVVSRVARLYPAYWVAVPLTFAVGALWPLPDQDHGALMLAANMTMLQAYLFVPPVDGVYWSLAYELGFYTVMLGLFLLGLLDRIVVIGWVWLGLALYAHSPADAWLHIPVRVALLLALKYAHLFIAGMMFYEIWRKGYAHSRLALLVGCLGVQLVLEGSLRTLVAAGFYAVFWIAISGKASRLCVPPLLWLGAISYPLYLTHQMLGYRIIASLRQAGAGYALAAAAALIFALGLASAITWLVERPGRRWLRRALAVPLRRPQDRKFPAVAGGGS